MFIVSISSLEADFNVYILIVNNMYTEKDTTLRIRFFSKCFVKYFIQMHV